MLKNLITLATISILWFVGCTSSPYKMNKDGVMKDGRIAGYKWKEASPYNFSNTMQFQKQFDDVWNTTIQWLGMNNIPIKNIDKSSGFISSESFKVSDNNICDCGYHYWDKVDGTIEIKDYVVPNYSNGTTNGTFNIVVRNLTDGTVEVTVNSFYKLQYSEFVMDRTWSYERNCVSKGALELTLFKFITDK